MENSQVSAALFLQRRTDLIGPITADTETNSDERLSLWTMKAWLCTQRMTSERVLSKPHGYYKEYVPEM